jgi:hypothetical protein
MICAEQRFGTWCARVLVNESLWQFRDTNLDQFLIDMMTFPRLLHQSQRS